LGWHTNHSENLNERKFVNLFKCLVITAGLLLVDSVLPDNAQAAINSWEPLPLETQAAYGFTHKMTLYATNCSALSSNTAANLFPVFNASTTVAAGVRITAAAVRVGNSQFAGGPMTACTVKLGDTTNPTSLMSAQGIGTNVTAGTWYLSTNAPLVFNAATNLVITLTPTAAGNGLLTNLVKGTGSGSIDIYLRLNQLNNLNNN